MNIAKNNLIKIINNKYCFYYNDELIESKQEFKQAISDGLKLEDLLLFTSDSTNIIFDKRTCHYENCGGDYYWLSEEETPDEIIWADYSEEYVHLDNAVYCWINGRHQEYVNGDQITTYEYNGEYYIYEALADHELMEYDGEIYSYDDMRYCEDVGEHLPQYMTCYDEDEDCYYSQEYNNNGLRGYHKSKIKDKSNNARIKIGFEIEKEDSNFKDFRNVRAINWDAERDGSLNNNGFELVSAIYDLEDLTNFKQDTALIVDFLNADSSKNCGGHINISMNQTNKETFNLIRGYVPLIYAMYYGRLDNRFTTAKKVNELGGYNRYDAFNFTKDCGILEFRIFSAVKTREQLIWRAELMALIFKHHRKGSAAVLKMLFTDSEIKEHLLKIYSISKFNALIDRVIKYTDIYMTAKDSQQTARIIIDHKNKAQTLTDAQTIINENKTILLQP